MCATTSETTSLAMSTLSSGGRKMQSEQWLNSITAGSMGRLCMLSCLLSPTSGNRAVGSTRWGNVPEVASATSCTCDPYPGTSDGSCTGGDPGAGHPQGPILATVPEKETGDAPRTTGMAASETLTPLPFNPDRHRCSWPGPLHRAPFTLQPHLPQILGFHNVIYSTQGPSSSSPPLIKSHVVSGVLLPACGL